MLLGFLVFAFLDSPTKRSDLPAEIAGAISLISIVALVILHDLQPETTVQTPLLSSEKLRHRRVLTWASTISFVSILPAFWAWIPSWRNSSRLLGLLFLLP